MKAFAALSLCLLVAACSKTPSTTTTSTETDRCDPNCVLRTGDGRCFKTGTYPPNALSSNGLIGGSFTLRYGDVLADDTGVHLTCREP